MPSSLSKQLYITGVILSPKEERDMPETLTHTPSPAMLIRGTYTARSWWRHGRCIRTRRKTAQRSTWGRENLPVDLRSYDQDSILPEVSTASGPACPGDINMGYPFRYPQTDMTQIRKSIVQVQTRRTVFSVLPCYNQELEPCPIFASYNRILAYCASSLDPSVPIT